VSGRPRQPAPTAAEELRQLTREAHEAAQEVRDAVRAARKILQDDLAGEVREAVVRLNEHVAVEGSRVTAELREVLDEIKANWEERDRRDVELITELTRKLQAATEVLTRSAAQDAMSPGAPGITIRPRKTQ
jgi:hypothetical protein